MHVNEKAVDQTASEQVSGMEGGKSGIKLNEQTKGRLGLHLRAMYDELIAQPVPDRFKELIARLDDPTSSRNEHG